MWCWEYNGKYKPYSQDISQKLDSLSIGEAHIATFGDMDYEITKLSSNQCEQKNISTNNTRNVILRCNVSLHNELKQCYDDDEEEKHKSEKWYYKDDSGQYKQCGYNVSKSLSELAVGDIKKLQIYNKWYEFKKISMNECNQTNIKSKNIRQCRVAQYAWYYKNSNDKFVAFTDDEVNNKLNEAKIGEKITFSIKRNKYCVLKTSFNNGKQTNLSSNKSRDVLRKMILNEDIFNKNTIDKNKVKELFHKTCSKSKYKIVEIKDLTKSENGAIYEGIIKEKCKKSGKKRDKIERYLWHGTKDLTNLKLIINNGFDRSFNTASRYGTGTYFARDASYSVTGGYCGKDKFGVSHILICKVIVGDYCVGNSSIKTIPRKSNGTEYETLVDSKKNPSIFVVWRDYHAVPCYLVKYK